MYTIIPTAIFLDSFSPGTGDISFICLVYSSGGVDYDSYNGVDGSYGRLSVRLLPRRLPYASNEFGWLRHQRRHCLGRFLRRSPYVLDYSDDYAWCVNPDGIIGIHDYYDIYNSYGSTCFLLSDDFALRFIIH